MSGEALFSPDWHRVRGLQPRLAGDVHVVRHLYRGRSSHLLQRASTSAHHRLDSLAWDLVSRFDGRRTVESLWQDAQDRHGDAAPTQPELLALLATLHEADLLVVDRALDAERLFSRGRTDARREARRRLASPLYLRFALCDPDRWLERLEPLSRPLFTRTAFALWSAAVVVALARVVPERHALLAELGAVSGPSPAHVAAFVAVYVVMKSVHEAAHALTIKRHGGRVREFGIALMVLLPNPFTDASAATMFASKRRRMQVSAAGIVAELGVAAVAAIVWSVSDGTVRDLALLTMLVGGLSTLLFNANPLLKFDGYHLLADALEIPNLASRSRRHTLDALARFAFGAAAAPPPDPRTDRRERLWLTAYGIASSAYRVALMLGIAWMLSGRWFFFGALLAAYAVVTALLLPAWRLVAFVHALPSSARTRAVAASLLSILALAAFAMLVPLPRTSLAEGVVWLPERAILRAGHRCDVVEVFVEPGTLVAADTPLLRCEDVGLAVSRELARARLREISAARTGLSTIDPARHAALGREASEAAAELALIEKRVAGQLIRSAASGRFSVEGQQSLVGRHHAQGEIVAYVVPRAARTIRVALTQDEIGRVERSVREVDVALLQHPGEAGRFASRIVRRTPKPGTDVVSPVLTELGGGRLAAHEDAAGRLRLLEPAFDLELDWPQEAPASRVGGAVRVRFVHAAEPLAVRLANGLARAFTGRASS